MNETQSKPHKSIFLAGVALLALLAGAAAGWVAERLGAPGSPQLQAGTALHQQAKPLPSFSLVDDTGRTFDNDRLADKWSFMFFGYTHCPDICPTTLSTLNDTVRLVAKHRHARDMQVVFVSVDPQRDTPNKLNDYVNYFNPRFVGVTGSQGALDDFLRGLGILHARVPDPDQDGAYLVDHSASILLLSPAGELVALFGPPHRSQSLASDFLKLRGHYEQS